MRRRQGDGDKKSWCGVAALLQQPRNQGQAVGLSGSPLTARFHT